jgi:hypothetical protein
MQRHVAGNRDRAGLREREKRGELLVGFFGCAAVGAVTADFKAGDDDVETAVPLNLPLQSVEQVAFKFSNFAAPQACHVNVISLGAALVVVFFTLHVHQVQLINQTVTLQQAESAIHRNPVNLRIEASCPAQ